MSVSVSRRSPVTYFESDLDDVQYRFGCPHLAYLTVFDIRLPVPLRPANGFPVLPDGSITRPFSMTPLLRPRLLLALRHLGTRAL
jgi:hypothetical protein